MIAAAAPLRDPLTCASNPTVTNYSCRIREVRLDLADQRLTSGMVHGPEFGLTPWNAREALGAVFIPKAPC
jgi:hypothetical protein